ncbi:MAG: alpha/beta fold hydrolase [Acidimicrobiia bacterium]|nr:alpha/beta fold hydrolase [Acidimicrobiia bacterium]
MLGNRFVLVGVFVGLGLAAKRPVTLESITQAPASRGAGSVAWAPDGDRFLRIQGTRVKLYEVKSRTEKDLLDMKEMESTAAAPREAEAFGWVNRRVRSQRAQWSGSGKELLLQVRGDLFLYEVGSGKWKQLTKTTETEHDPKLSPDGKKVGYRLAHDLYVLEIASGKQTRLTHDGSPSRGNGELDWVYPEELDLGTAHWWSPDSRHIAYLQFDTSALMVYPHGDITKVRPVSEPQRYPQAGTPNSVVRLGVVAATGGKTKWAEWNGPSDGLIGRVEWLPEGGALAVQQLTRIQDKLRLVSVKPEGKMQPILEESSSAWVNLKDDSRFLRKSPQLIWGSERDGYRHLYLQPRNGGEGKRLTSGDWEVTDLSCVDEERESIYYVSTEVSPLERHLYRVGFDGKGKQRLTKAAGTHAIEMAPGCGYYLDTHSSLREPSKVTLHSHDGAELAVVSAQDRKVMDEFEILPTELVRYQGAGGEFHARLIKPAGFDASRKYPAIVMVYGGPHAQSVRNSWRGADWDQALAHRGFVVWQVDNRGSAGRGHVWEKPLHRRFGKTELADQLEGVKHLVSLGFVDEKRIGMYGWSYGGYMTLYSLLNSPDTFRAGVAGAPVTDWRNYDTIYTERYLGLPQENEEGYKLSSPVHQAKELKSRLLLVHNFEDDNVLFQHTLRMMDALQRAGKPFDLQLYPQKSHGVGGAARRHMLEAITAFFERHLQEKLGR